MIIDENIILSFERDIGVEATKEILSIFIVEQTSMKDEIFKALENKDLENLKQLAHKAKSSVLAVGMKDLHAELERFEKTNLEEINFEYALSVAKKFEKEVNLAIDEINNYLNSRYK